MPRSPLIYNLPPGTTPQQPNTPIESAMFNTAMEDIEQTFNTPMPVPYGGTGQSTDSGVKSYFGMITVIRAQGFAVSGTYTPHPFMVYCIIEAWGGGGGGAGVAGNVGFSLQAGGGGAGAYSRKIAARSLIGASKPVVIGAFGVGGAAGFNNGTSGGDTTVGSFLRARGGRSAEAVSSGFIGAPASGGAWVNGDGDMGGRGVNGGPGFQSVAGHLAFSGIGGSTTVGAGGIPTFNSNGLSSDGYGAGGAGGWKINVIADAAGGNGSAGLVFITEFCSE